MTGKWDQPDVPKKGWTCTNVSDLEDGRATCEMCEVQTIRYVHTMEHPEHGEALDCGCICAGHMEEDPDGARERERGMRRTASRKDRWLFRQWHVSRNGNPFLNADGYNVTVYPKGDAWGFRVLNRATEDALVARQDYPTQVAAQLRAFDAVQWMRARGR